MLCTPVFLGDSPDEWQVAAEPPGCAAEAPQLQASLPRPPPLLHECLSFPDGLLNLWDPPRKRLAHHPPQAEILRRHSFKAGNHGDVLKHSVLLSVVKRMTRKDKPCMFLDTHASVLAPHSPTLHLKPPTCFHSNAPISILFASIFPAISLCQIPSPRGVGPAYAWSP